MFFNRPSQNVEAAFFHFPESCLTFYSEVNKYIMLIVDFLKSIIS